MARKKIPNIEQRIMDATVALSSEIGYDKLSATKIAQRCGVTDTTLFSYFGTMDKLYEATYNYVFEQLSAKIEDKTVDSSNWHLLWLSLFDLILTHADGARYCFFFELGEGKNWHVEPERKAKCIKLVKTLFSAKFGFVSDDECYDYWMGMITITAYYALKVADGFMPDTLKSRELIFRIIFNARF